MQAVGQSLGQSYKKIKDGYEDYSRRKADRLTDAMVEKFNYILQSEISPKFTSVDSSGFKEVLGQSDDLGSVITRIEKLYAEVSTSHSTWNQCVEKNEQLFIQSFPDFNKKVHELTALRAFLEITLEGPDFNHTHKANVIEWIPAVVRAACFFDFCSRSSMFSSTEDGGLSTGYLAFVIALNLGAPRIANCVKEKSGWPGFSEIVDIREPIQKSQVLFTDMKLFNQLHCEGDEYKYVPYNSVNLAKAQTEIARQSALRVVEAREKEQKAASSSTTDDGSSSTEDGENSATAVTRDCDTLNDKDSYASVVASGGTGQQTTIQSDGPSGSVQTSQTEAPTGPLDESSAQDGGPSGSVQTSQTDAPTKSLDESRAQSDGPSGSVQTDEQNPTVSSGREGLKAIRDLAYWAVGYGVPGQTDGDKSKTD